MNIRFWRSIFQEEEKRKVAQKEAEDERKKKHIKEEYQREKVNSKVRTKHLRYPPFCFFMINILSYLLGF